MTMSGRHFRGYNDDPPGRQPAKLVFHDAKVVQYGWTSKGVVDATRKGIVWFPDKVEASWSYVNDDGVTIPKRTDELRTGDKVVCVILPKWLRDKKRTEFRNLPKKDATK